MTHNKNKHLKILKRFIEVYCNTHHEIGDGVLCDECANLLDYAKTRLERCPYNPKPACKDCATHCYQPHYRERIQAVMCFSGVYFVKRGRID